MFIRKKWLVVTVFTQAFTTEKKCLAMGFKPTIDLLHSAAGVLPLIVGMSCTATNAHVVM